MKQFTFMILILACLITWPFVTQAKGQRAALLLTPTLPCSPVTMTPIPSQTPTFIPSHVAETPIATPTTPTASDTYQNYIPFNQTGPLIAGPTPTPSANPCATYTPTATFTPTPTPTFIPVFTATVHVVPHDTLIAIGEILTVTVTVDFTPGCQFPIYELTLSQTNDVNPPFVPSEPIVLGPGVSMPQAITVTAVTTGTTAFRANIFSEYNCGQWWNWTYQNGQSTDVYVGDIPNEIRD